MNHFTHILIALFDRTSGGRQENSRLLNPGIKMSCRGIKIMDAQKRRKLILLWNFLRRLELAN